MVQLTSNTGWALMLGTTLGLGLWLIVSLVPRFGRPRLADRLAPYLVDVSADARALVARKTVDPLPVVGALFAPVANRLRAALERVLGGADTIALRLRQAGDIRTVESFRSSQLQWGALGAVTGVVLAIAVNRSNSLPPTINVGIVILGAVGGVIARDQVLVRAARARVGRLSSELPTVLEFLTLSLSAGEGILDAIRRVARVSNGELSIELGRVVAAVNSGVPLTEALNGLATDVRLPALSRCVEQIVGALERGTPLAEVLRAQAQDSRDEAKRELLEISGKKEVGMMIPLVFLILPITILFAVFPASLVLRFGS